MLGIKINKVIKFLILSDLAFWTGWGLITPVFAIFVLERIEGGSPFVAGLAAGLFWIFRSFFRVPISIFLDTCPGERDDYLFLITGLFLAALIPFGFIFATIPLHVYLLQAVHGVAMAMSLSGWSAIFTRHIDKGREATNWGIDATLIGFGVGISGMIGGWAVTRFNFESVFFAVGIMGLIGAFLLLAIRKDIKGIFDHGMHFSLKDIFSKEEEK
jgi:hypothetical protein